MPRTMHPPALSDARDPSSDVPILLLEDDPDDVEFFQDCLTEALQTTPRLERVATLGELRERLERGRYGCVFLDLNVPDSVGLDTLDGAMAAAGDVPVAVLTGHTDETFGLEAVRRGAMDFLCKGRLTPGAMARTLRYAEERRRRTLAERRFRALVGTSRELYTILDADLRVRYVSPAIEGILGYAPQEIVHEGARPTVHPDDADAVAGALGRLRDGASVERIQCRARHADDGWRWLDTVGENRLSDPALEGIVLHTWDVTDLRVVEDELRRVRRRLEVLRTVAARANQADSMLDAMAAVVPELPAWIGWDRARAYCLQDGAMVPCPGPAGFGQGPSAAPELVEQARATGRVCVRPESGRRARDGAAPGGSAGRALTIPVSDGRAVVSVVELTCDAPGRVEPTLVSLMSEVGVQLSRVAERERAVAEIEEGRVLLRKLVEGVPDALFVKDRAGRYMLINEAGAAQVGRTPESVTGQSDLDLFEPETAARIMADDARLMDEGVTRTIEEETVDTSGRRRVYLSTKGPLTDDDGRCRGVFGISRDVTQLRQARSALEHRMRELRVLYDGARLLSDTRTPLPERLEALAGRLPEALCVPEQAEAAVVLGDDTYATAGFRATPWVMASEVQVRGRVVGALRVALLEGPDTPADARHDPAPFTAEQRELLDALAKAVGETVERDALEREVVQAQRMEAVGRLSGGIAHDFNNLLTVIHTHADYLLQALPEGDPAADEVQTIRDATDRASELTRQLLAYGKEQVLRPRNVDLNEVVRTIGRLTTRILGENIEVRLDTADALPAVRVDAGQIEQALLNLAVNAKDAMAGGGVLTLGTEVVDAEGRPVAFDPAHPEAFRVRVRVADTGVGMDEETRLRAFEPFFTTKVDRGGTGLGLAMVHGIVEQSGGAIQIDSTPGVGTTFTLHFPGAAGEVERTTEAEPLPEPSGDPTGRILVVEDDDSVRRVAEKTLARAGFTVDAVSRAEEGIERLSAHAYDAVLTDLVLPGLSGRDVIARARAIDASTPVIAMSGYADGVDDREGLPPGVDFLQKPFSLDDLVGIVRRAVGSREV